MNCKSFNIHRNTAFYNFRPHQINFMAERIAASCKEFSNKYNHFIDVYCVSIKNKSIKKIKENIVQYCAMETCGENEIPFHFPHLFHTNSQDGSFCKHFSLIFPLFPHWRNTIPQFSTNFPRIPPIP